jgi:peroxiredoxin
MTLHIGEYMKSFHLKNVDGRILSSDALIKDRKALVVIFSCNHCPYVQAWENRLIVLSTTYHPKGAAFVLINANDPVKYPEDSFSEMVKRAKSKDYPFPYLHDEDQAIARAYEATRTPEVFLFDSQKVLRYHGRIDDHYDDPGAVRSHDLRDALDAVLSGRSPSKADTAPIGCTIKWK